MSRTVSTVSLALALLAASFAACAGTSGRPIAFPVIADARSAAVFRTSTGWEVVLEEARLGLVALRVQRDGDDAITAARLLVPLARAHGGHGVAEGVRAELLGPLEVDALASDPVELGVAVGSSGPAGAVDLELGALGGAAVVARVRGVATRDDEEVSFAGELVIDGGLAVRTPPLGVVLEEGVMRVVVRAERWLDQARFESLSGATIDSAGQVALAWSLGLRDARAFAVEWEASAEGGE